MIARPLALIAVTLTMLAGAVLAADSWADRIAENLARLEGRVSAIDAKRTNARTPLEVRVRDLDERVRVLEVARRLERGSVALQSGEKLLASLTDAVIGLERRIAIVETTPVPQPEPDATPHGTKPIPTPPPATVPRPPAKDPEPVAITYADILDRVFNPGREQADRVAAWRAMVGKRFRDTGVLRSIDGTTAKVRFGTAECKVVLAAPMRSAPPFGAEVRVDGLLADYWFGPKSVDLVDASLVPTGNRPANEDDAHLRPGDICEAVEEVLVLRDHERPATELELIEKIVGSIKVGERFEVRKSEGVLTPYYYVVSHADLRVRGWALAAATKAKILQRR